MSDVLLSVAPTPSLSLLYSTIVLYDRLYAVEKCINMDSSLHV